MFIPEEIYAKVEDKLLKTSSVEKIGERVEIDLQNNSNKMRENVSANAESTKWEEELTNRLPRLSTIPLSLEGLLPSV